MNSFEGKHVMTLPPKAMRVHVVCRSSPRKLARLEHAVQRSWLQRAVLTKSERATPPCGSSSHMRDCLVVSGS